jgi:non-specific serine/threonine protein kinase/serine/threonine-protein kinase
VTALSAHQLARVDALLDELLDLPVETRPSVLERRCSDDPAVRTEVSSLLSAAGAVGDFLATPVRLAGEPAAEDLTPGTRLGVWRLTDRIGRGGMGVVYEAERAAGDYDQHVAVKVLRQEAIAELPRFHIERQILARLEHPGIARLHDGGVTADSRPYMVMEFVEGQPITAYCASRGATLPERMQLFLQVCEAVAYAHGNLIVHRDLKSANILVTAQGQVKLLDFGIAKLIDLNRPEQTQTVAAPLTPHTAAPEQLLGKAVTTATDVYALGLLLFELLTDTQPWLRAGGPIAHAVRVILDEPAPVPSRRALETPTPPVAPRLLRGDFDSIVAKATRKEPQHRYATVEALQRDVESALRGEPVSARSGARFYFFSRTLRRYRWVTVAVAAVLVSLAIGLGVAAWQARRAETERDAARRDAAREEAVRYQLTRLFRTAIEEHGMQPATAKAMIDDSAQRVLREYRAQPQLQAQIVLTLADLYGALQDAEGGSALLAGFVKQAGPDTDPAALADARQKLAAAQLLQGHSKPAADLIAQSEAFWNQHPGRYTEERLEGLTIKARVRRASGDIDGALATEKVAIDRRIAVSGRNHRETAVLYNTHALTLSAANRFDEAIAAYRETLNIYKRLGLEGELDTQVALGNLGMVEYRTGHLREAESLLRTACERERALAGDSAAVAAVMGLYGEVLTVGGRAVQSLPIAKEAVEVATRYAGASSPVALQNGLFLADAQSATGDQKGARATLVTDRDAAAGQYGAKNLATLRARTALANFDFREAAGAGSGGAAGAARAELVSVIAQLTELGTRGDTFRAQALQYVGEIDLAAGNPVLAAESLRAAIAIWSQFAAQGWNVGIARERRGEALVAAKQGGAAEELSRAVQILSAELGPEHPEAVRANTALRALDRATRAP